MSIYELKKIEEFENLPLNVLYKIMELTENVEQNAKYKAQEEIENNNICDIEYELGDIEDAVYEIKRKLRGY